MDRRIFFFIRAKQHFSGNKLMENLFIQSIRQAVEDTVIDAARAHTGKLDIFLGGDEVCKKIV